MKLAKVDNHGRKRWRLSYSQNGKQVRRFFKSKVEAEAKAQMLAGERRGPGRIWVSLTESERIETGSVIEEVMQAGFTMRTVWEGFKSNCGVGRMLILKEAVAEVVRAKQLANRRDSYIKTLRQMLGAFIKGRESSPAGSVTTEQIEAFLATKESVWSRATWRNRLNTLFSFCLRRGYVLRNPCERIDRVTVEYKPPTVLSVEQCEKALHFGQCNPRFLGWLTLALLAGIRPEEADRIRWVDVDLVNGTVRVDAAASKVRQRRIVHLQPSAVAWLTVARELASPLPLPGVTRRRYLRKLRARLGFSVWPKDVLRHCAASYWVALWQDVGKVANELGNSAGVLLRHYRELVTKAEAERFWALLPIGPMPATGTHPEPAPAASPLNADKPPAVPR